MPGQGTTKDENHPHPASPVEGEEFRISDGAEIELRLEVGPDFSVMAFFLLRAYHQHLARIDGTIGPQVIQTKQLIK